MKVIRTNDGTDTLYNNKLNEHYHSIHGAKNESQHVFIDMGLESIIKSQDEIKVFEMGFGTGLNALLSLQWAIKNETKIIYNAVEFYPLKIETISKLNFSEMENLEALKQKFITMHECSWEFPALIDPNFELTKCQISLNDVKPDQNYDIIFFDAFSPDKQPELWTVSIFRKMYDLLNDKGKLVTYCAKGYVRRNMIEAGFTVERLAGPPGKREMLRALK